MAQSKIITLQHTMNSPYARTREVRRLRTQLMGGNRQKFDNNRIMADPASHTAEIRTQLGLTMHSPARVAEIERWSADYAETVRQAGEKLGWPVPDTIRVRLDWREMRVRDRGGAYRAGWRDEAGAVQDLDPNDYREDGAGISLVGGGFPLAGDLDIVEGLFAEYDTLAADPEIGNHYGNPCRLVIVHEVAHAIQFHIRRHGLDWAAVVARIFGAEVLPTHRMGAGHDELWQAIYRSLRRHFGFTHSRAAQEAADALNQICPQCGATFQVNPGRGRRPKFCSTKCRVGAHRAQQEKDP